MEIHSPRNTQAVELYYRGEKMAKVCEPLSLSLLLLEMSVIYSVIQSVISVWSGDGFPGNQATGGGADPVWSAHQERIQLSPH